jgi:hypothetical protein
MRRAAAMAMLGLALGAGCGDDGGVREVRGHLRFAFELNAFQSCGRADLIWVDRMGNARGWPLVEQALASDPACPRLDVLSRECSLKTVYVEMAATVSGPGKYGHLNKFTRELQIMEVHQAALAGPAACALVEPKYPGQ